MPPTLILIRHAEAEHNATENWDLPDPLLTRKGEQQCRDMREHLMEQCPRARDVELIVSSPLRRTIQTTLIGLDWLIEKGVPVELDAAWQAVRNSGWRTPTFSENSNSACDTGSDLASVATQFPTLDFSKVDPVFPSTATGTPYAFTRAASLARGQACLRKLYDRPESVIAVVSHSAFLRTAVCQRRFANADYRIFTFGRQTRGGLQLVEDPASEQGGGMMGRSEKGFQKIRTWDFPREKVEEMAR